MQQYQWIGWLSSLLLISTIAKQIHKQWRTRSARDVSKYLFIGQVAAELGFVCYSYLTQSWIFFAVNIALLVENAVGLWVTLKLRSTDRAGL